MLLKYFYDENLAQASYLVGCAQTGEALVVDPARDVTPYLEAAAAEDLKITHVTETHIHADFVSGSRELHARTGAQIYLSDMGDAAWKYGYATDDGAQLVRDGDSWMVGNVRVDVLHTPGHTPEHIAFMITDTAGADQPMGIFTGDFLFAGDVGRPDLLETAAGMAGTKEPGARQQYQSVATFKQLPDYLQIWPGHGAGSACGKALGAIPSTTLGYEKLFNPAFQLTDEAAFVEWLLSDQPEAPQYFARMKHVNKVGPALLSVRPAPQQLTADDVEVELADGTQVIDFRSPAAYNAAYLPGTVNIPASSASFVTYAGWFVDYEQPLVFITPDTATLSRIMQGLQSIGVDNIDGYALPDVVKGASATLSVVNAPGLAERMQHNGLVLVDVRGQTEYAEHHIRGARNIPLGYLPDRLNELPHDHTIVTHCASGLRSQIAASVLRKYGFEDVLNLVASTAEWSAVLETE